MGRSGGLVELLDRLMMRPQPAWRIAGSACWIRSIGAWKFISNIASRAGKVDLAGRRIGGDRGGIVDED